MSVSNNGVVAAGHPVTAQAGARVLREGGNAVDAAIAAMLASFVAEPLLTGLGAGGYMMVACENEPPVLLDFFVEAPPRAHDGSAAELEAVDVSFGDAIQVFYIGPASCGVYGTPAGICMAADRWGSISLADLVSPAAALAREGVVLNAEQAYVVEILGDLLCSTPECSALWAPSGALLREGGSMVNPELADALERLGAEGAEPFYRGEVASAVCSWLSERGGSITPDALARYRAIEREPLSVAYRDRTVLTNPPPSAGGTLLAYSLALLDREPSPPSLAAVIGAMEAAQAERTPEFLEGLAEEGFLERFFSARLAPDAANASAAGRRGVPGVAESGPGVAESGPGVAESGPGVAESGPGEAPDRRSPGLGATTHISVLDARGQACSVTCTNGEGSGVVVPGTGIHLNNVMGEEDLSPLGFHRHPAGRRMPSMMAPSIVEPTDRRSPGSSIAGDVELVLGSAGSNRIRSALLQTIVGVVDHGLDAREAVRAPRVHFEDGIVYHEPGIEPAAVLGPEREIVGFHAPNLFFGGVQAVQRSHGRLIGAGDPRRGGVAVTS